MTPDLLRLVRLVGLLALLGLVVYLGGGILEAAQRAVARA